MKKLVSDRMASLDEETEIKPALRKLVETAFKAGATLPVERIGSWTTQRGDSPRLYPRSREWCGRKPGRELRRKVGAWLAWERVVRELNEGVLGEEYDRAERSQVRARVRDAHEAAKDEVWAGYRVRSAGNMVEHVKQILNDLGLADRVRVQKHGGEQ